MAHFTDIRALAFDLDGTLVDSAPGLADAIDRTLNDLRLPQAGLERVSTWIGNGADIMMARALTFALGREPQPEEQRDARALFDRHYADTVDAGSTLFPQVKQTLAALKAAGLPMAIVTNKPTPFVAPLLESLGIADAFSLIIGGDDVPVKNRILRQFLWCWAPLVCCRMSCCLSATHAMISRRHRRRAYPISA